MHAFDLKRVHLRPPDAKYEKSYFAGLAELRTDSERASWVYLARDAPLDTPAKDFEAYVRRLRSTETEAPPNFVRSTCYWAICEDELIGRIAIRHELNEFLGRIGGHIGYIVRPSFRRMGAATEMLRQILQTERARSIGKLLLTCDEGNVASELTIRRNGGVYEDTVLDAERGKNKKRFWITV